MIRTFLALLAAIALAGCAATYKPPATQQQIYTKNVEGTRDQIFNAAKKALIIEGYQPLTVDKDAGTIITTKRRMDLTARDCDCGTTMGLPYIKDKRTVTAVSVGVIVGHGNITIKPTIDGEYLKSHTIQSITMQCVSKGTIERKLYSAIVAALE